MSSTDITSTTVDNASAAAKDLSMIPLPDLTHLIVVESHDHVRFTTIPVSVAASFVLGGLWYSPVLFGKTWVRLINKKREELGGMFKPMIVSIVALIGMACGMYVFIDDLEPGAVNGMIHGCELWAVLVATTMAQNYAYTKRPILLWIIDSGYHLGCLVIMGSIMGAWRT